MTGHLGRVLGPDGAPVGTCFQVAPGVLVTAAHLLADLGTVVLVDPLAGGDPFAAQVITTRARDDLALLRGTRDLAASIPRLGATRTVPPGATVTVTAAGHLDDAEHTYRFVTATGEWKGTAARDGTELGTFTSRDVLPGMSGAPVCLASDGSVVGVQSGRYHSGDGWFGFSAWVGGTEALAALLRGVAAVPLLDVSEPAVRWRDRRAAYTAALTRAAHHRRDAFLVDNCGPPFVPVFVQEHVDAKEKPPRPAADLLSTAEDVLLLGGPGAGKSRLLWSWALALVDDGTRIPVPVRATDLATAVGSSLGRVPPLDALASAVDAALGAAGQEGPPWLAEWFAESRSGAVEWVVLVDGLDEVPDDLLRNRVRAALTALRAHPGWRCRVVVSSRPPPGAGTGDATRYDLLPFGETERGSLVHGWFAGLGFADPDRAARDFLAQLDLRGLHDLAGIPLMLVILAQLFAYDPERGLPGSRVAAYERIVAEAHRRRPRAEQTAEVLAWHDERLPAAVATLHDRLGDVDGLLSRLAFARFLGRAGSAVDWIADQTADLRRTTRLSPDHWRLVVREALRRTSLVVAQGDDFRFVHETLHEFFAARHLARDKRLSRELLWLVASVVTRVRHDTVMEWIFAFWSTWPPFTTTLLRLPKKHDPLTAGAFVTWLVRRWVRVDPSVTDTARTHLRALLDAGTPPDDPLRVPYLLASLKDRRGLDTLSAIARDPARGVDAVNAARRLVHLREPGAKDLLAAATEAFVTAPEPVHFTDNDARMRREAAENLARLAHPDAVDILRLLLRDPRTDDGRTRRYVCGLLGDHPTPHLADVVTALFTTVAPTDAHEALAREWYVTVLLRMTDPGSTDRIALLASAHAMPTAHRVKAAIHLATLADSRAADCLAALTTDPAALDDETFQEVAWALARVGDPRATPLLVTTAQRTPVIRWWWYQAKAAATDGDPRTADVLLAAAESPDMPPRHASEILKWLTLTGDPRGAAAATRATAKADLLGLADALARQRDPRFTAPLTRWANHLPDEESTAERQWATRVLATPDRFLGDGLLADYVTRPDLDPPARLLELDTLRVTDHPRMVDCLLTVHRELEARAPEESSRWQRSYVVELLANAGNAVVVPILAQHLRDGERETWLHPMDLLVRLDGQEVADALADLAPVVPIEHHSPLAHKLGELDDPRLGAVLADWVITSARRRTYFDGLDWRLRQLRDLNDHHLVEVHDHLVDLVLSGRSDVTPEWAIADVARTGVPQAANILARWSKDNRFPEEDRRRAVRALATMDPTRAGELGHTPSTPPPPTSQRDALFRYYKKHRDRPTDRRLG